MKRLYLINKNLHQKHEARAHISNVDEVMKYYQVFLKQISNYQIFNITKVVNYYFVQLAHDWQYVLTTKCLK